MIDSFSFLLSIFHSVIHQLPRSLSTRHRIHDNVSVKSGLTAPSDISSHARLETQFQGLVITDDQMQQLRLQKQQRQQHQSCRKPNSKKERKETLRERGADLAVSSSTSSSKPWDLESSADSSLRSACASCVECPVAGSTAAAAAEDVITPTTALESTNGDHQRDDDDTDDSALSQRPLEYISLSGCYRLTDSGLLHMTRSSYRGIEDGLPNLRHLDLSGCMNVSVEGLLPVLETCPLINFSHLFYCDNVYLGEGIDDLASGCRNLQRGRVCCRTGL